MTREMVEMENGSNWKSFFRRPENNQQKREQRAEKEAWKS